MNCFTNFITVRGTCNDITPVSGLFINDLSGISLKMINALSEEEQKNFEGVYSEAFTRSVTQLSGDILVAMQKFFKTKILLDGQQSGFLDKDISEVASNNLKGASVEIIGTKNTEIFINHVQVMLSTVADVSKDTIKIYDMNFGTLLDTVTYTPIVGLNTIQINKRYSVNGQDTALFVAYDGNVGNSFKASSHGWLDSEIRAHSRGGEIAIGSQVLEDDISFDGDTRGLIINYNVQCSIDNFVCSNKDLFKIALWYLIGSNLMNDRINTTRVNEFTLNNKETAEALRDDYRQLYKEQLDSVLDNLTPHDDGVCFACSKSRTYVYNVN